VSFCCYSDGYSISINLKNYKVARKIYTDVHIQMCIYRCTYADEHIQMHIYRCTYTDVHMQMYRYRYTYADVHIQMYIYRFTYKTRKYVIFVSPAGVLKYAVRSMQYVTSRNKI
jgi:hypothetical protein